MTTLSRRFSGAFILLVAMPSLVVSVILSRLYLTALRKTVELHSQAIADQVAQNVRAETESTAILAAALYTTASCGDSRTATPRPRARPSASCGRVRSTRSW